MSVITNAQPVDYIKAITQLVQTLSMERIVQVYEYAQSLQTEGEVSPQISKETAASEIDLDDDSWLFCSEEEMEAEDELWDTFLMQNQEYLNSLKTNATTEIQNGTTQPMFDIEGWFVVEEYIEHEIEDNS